MRVLIEIYTPLDSCVWTIWNGCWLPDVLSVENPEITCINFNDGTASASNGLYVLNDGVAVDSYTECADGMCGYFNGSARLEIPYFSNSYDHFKQFRVTFDYYKESGNTNDQAFVSNDCLNNQQKAIGNSLYVASSGAFLGGGLKDLYGNAVNSMGAVSIYAMSYTLIDQEHSILLTCL